MKYPFVLLFRLDKYSYIDTFFKKNKDKLLCSVFITNKKEMASFIVMTPLVFKL